jgi:MoCo/4Fe-4S cofactor protein with predicted Tat translocation signal
MSDKKYWNSLDQLEETPQFVEEAQKEFSEAVPVEDFLSKSNLTDTSSSRRDFLKFMGFSLGAATLAACETPVVKSIPYVVKPEVVTPGVPNWYASSYGRGGDFASILVKTREGRPIFIKPNKAYPEAMSGVTARVNASVIELYDDNRFQSAQRSGSSLSWADADKDIKSQLAAIKAKGGVIKVVTESTSSPSTKAALAKFDEMYSSVVEVEMLDEKGYVTGIQTSNESCVVTYDPINYNGILKANKADFGQAVIPTYDFSKAKTVVSLDADFIGDWLDNVTYSKGYTQRRNPDGAWMSKHFQFETNMTLSGANADVRGAIKPSDLENVAKMLHGAVAKLAGVVGATGSIVSDDNEVSKKLEMAVKSLWSSRGKSLVVCGSNDVNIQQVVNGINNMLGNFGNTVRIDREYNAVQMNHSMTDLTKSMNDGKVDAVIFMDANPVYSNASFAASIDKVGMKISLSDRPDETSALCDFVCPNHFYLEAWNDHQPYAGVFTMQQPVIRPLFKTRAAQESLLKWSGIETSYYDFIKSNWYSTTFAGIDAVSVENKWNQSVQSGVYLASKSSDRVEIVYTDNSANAAGFLNSKSAELEVKFYTKHSVGNGAQANNPHLQEMPDPISKVSWDNYVTMNPSDMEGKYEARTAQATPADMVSVTVNGYAMELPVVAVPGQKLGTIGIALGYGRTVTGKVGQTGVNAYPALEITDGNVSYSSSNVTIADAGKTYQIASVQTHHTMMGRKIVNETSLATFKSIDKNDKSNGWNKDNVLPDAFGEVKPIKELNLWEDHAIDLGHRWGMSIDLNSCTGCGACITACHIENNVPVVGKDEIRRTRSMFWLRVDRYFTSDMNKEKGKEEGVGIVSTYKQMENASAYPQVVFQPVMCQHCNHAPCETVCPVAATTHSEEGLNQMTYNRCVGTRYCANNCPYKVRRFNWFNYNKDTKFTGINPAQNELQRMVLNPDVVVRSRGVIEKCSFCVQKIQSGKLVAKKEGRPVQDGDVVSACSEACPTNAIQFGDLNDGKSKVKGNFDDDRSYHLIEEVGTQPNVAYMTKVRNT